MRRIVDPKIIEKRDKSIIEMIDKGMSVGAVGKLCYRSRERICQIYYKKTGKSVKQTRIEARIDSIQLAKIRKCLWCGCTLYIGSKFHSQFCKLAFWAEQQRRNYAKYHQTTRKRDNQITKQLTKELKKKWGIT